MEPADLHPRIAQRREEASREAAGAHRIEQQAHPHPGAGPFHQRIADQGAGPVRIDDVVLQMDVVACRGNGVEQRIEGARAAHEQVDARAARRRKAGGGVGQAREVGAVGVIVARRDAALQRGAGTSALELLPMDALRAEEVIDDEADHRQRREAEHPAQRCHRFALLQHDPAGQQQQIHAPSQRQIPAHVRDRCDRVPEAEQAFDHAASIVAASATARA